MTVSNLLEVFQVPGNMPGHLVAASYSVITGFCNYKRYHRLFLLNQHISDCYGSLDGRPGIVALQSKVGIVEIKYRAYIRIESHHWQLSRCTGKLLAHLVEMVEVDVHVPERMHEVSGSIAALLGHHHGQQGIRGDVERHSQKDISAALVELAGEPPVRHVELEEGVAGFQADTM